MSKPHILIIPPWFDIDFNHHYSKSYHRWARDLAHMGQAKVGLLYGDFSTGIRRREYFQKNELNYYYLGMRSWGLPKVGPGWLLWKGHYLRAFREYVRRYGRPTVIHGYSLLGLIVAGAIQRKYGIPFVYTEVLGSFITGRVPGRLVREAHKVVAEASYVCGISPGMVSALEVTFKVHAELLSLYVDDSVFKPDSFPAGPPAFISIGAPARTKGMDILIEAMSRIAGEIPEARLTIVDKIPEQSWLESLVSKFGLDRNIRFTGAVPHHQIPDYIHKSHVLVSASREESLGFTMLEAIFCGRPVVATTTPGSEYIVKKNRGKIVPQEDPGRLATAMIDVYQNREVYKPEEMHAMIQRQFGKDVILGAWMNIYDRCSKGDRK